MKKLLLIALCISYLMNGCGSPEIKDNRTEFHELLKPYLKKKISDLGKGEIVLTDIEILRIDTTSIKSDSLTKMHLLNEQLDALSKQSTLQFELASNVSEQAKLSRELDQTLYNMYKKEALEELEKAKGMGKAVQNLINRVVRIDSLVSTNTLDSISPTGFFVLLNIKATDQTNVIKDIDSVGVHLDLNKRIKDRQDMIEKL